MPSLLLLYTLDERQPGALTLKAVGHQWYWSYEYCDLWIGGEPLAFDSYIKPEGAGLPRVLDTDNRVVLPYEIGVRALVSRADVLHAWAVPSLGVKADACPGRLNQMTFTAYRPGVAFGQCSEICGANHRFMPIALELVRAGAFLQWARAALED